MTHDGSAQILVLNSSSLVAKAAEIHQTAITPTVAFGRVLTAASLMGSTLKDKGNSLTLNFRGDGKCGHILAVTDYMGNVRGTIQNPDAQIPLIGNQPNCAEAVGKGTLNVVKDTGEKQPYIGITDLVSGKIAEDVAHYYADSEQIPTVCALGELLQDGKVKAAGGLLILLLPLADPNTVDQIEKSVAQMPSVSSMLEQGLSNQEIAEKTLAGIQLDVFDEYEVDYLCDCSRERMGKALLTINPYELYQILVEDGKIEVCCQFCKKKFSFTGADIEEIRKKQKKESKQED